MHQHNKRPKLTEIIMITLTKAQVFKYKSIEDSTPVRIMDDVTVLVGKNESGKTAFLNSCMAEINFGSLIRSLIFSP